MSRRSDPSRRPAARSLRRTLAAAAIAAALAPGVGAAEQGETAEDASADAPPVSLERLLQLPDAYRAESEQRGGASQSEWRRRFREAHADVERARAQLARAQAQLEGVASESDAWQMAAPGTSNPETTPLSYRLREEIRRQRDEVERAERRLRDLEVEANLAAVPEEWRSPEP